MLPTLPPCAGERRRFAPGFTLVEMAVVVLVISLILAAITKGTGVLENAHGLKFAKRAMDAAAAQHQFFAQRGDYAGMDEDGDLVDANPEAELQQIAPAFKEQFIIPPAYRLRFATWEDPRDDGEYIMLVICRDDTRRFESRDLGFGRYLDMRLDDDDSPDWGSVLALDRGTGICNDTPSTIREGSAANETSWDDASQVRAVGYLFGGGYLPEP